MKKWNFILGVDVSKLTLDVHCAELNKHIKIANGTEGFKALKKWVKESRIDLAKSIIVMEYTGGYEYKLIQFCESLSISYTRIPGLAIKNSLGITRGKNDKVDAKRIANYADEKIKTISADKPLNKRILQLKELLSFRKRLVRINAGLKASLKERIHMYEVTEEDIIRKITEDSIKKNKEYIEKLDLTMMEIIAEDGGMLDNYIIITSIKGIGPVNALMTIVYTENFTSFTNPRTYAVYAGVIPFDHTSGTSVKGRKRVSHIANKELKQELNQAARTAIIWDKELAEYAVRKLQSKPYGIVLNNVKFKLILRMFSLVKRGELYVENYKKAG
jgi:transposase